MHLAELPTETLALVEKMLALCVVLRVTLHDLTWPRLATFFALPFGAAFLTRAPATAFFDACAVFAVLFFLGRMQHTSHQHTTDVFC